MDRRLIIWRAACAFSIAALLSAAIASTLLAHTTHRSTPRLVVTGP